MHIAARRAVASTTLVFLLLGNLTALAASNSSKAADAIKTADQQWAAAAAIKDLDKSVSFCGPDAAILVPNARTPSASGFTTSSAFPDSNCSGAPPSLPRRNPATWAIQEAHTN